MPNYEDHPNFQFHTPEIRKQQADINEYLSKLDPWSLFLHARLLSMKDMAKEGKSMYEIEKIHSLGPGQIQAIFDCCPGDFLASIIPKKHT